MKIFYLKKSGCKWVSQARWDRVFFNVHVHDLFEILSKFDFNMATANTTKTTAKRSKKDGPER